MSNQYYPKNFTAYATPETYYKTQFQAYQHMGSEIVWGGIPKDYKYRGNMYGSNYPQLKDLYRGEAAYYSKVCKKDTTQ